MSNVLLSVTYFGPIQYFSKFLIYNNVFIEQHETYQKQSFRNRCEIYGANGKLSLIIPVIKTFGNKTKTKDIKIDNSEMWQRNHWQSIISAYRSSPFFEFFEDELVKFYNKQYGFLFDFCVETIEYCLNFLGIDLKYKKTNSFNSLTQNQYADFRKSISPKRSQRKKDIHFYPIHYNQVFKEKHGFISNLSILDLIFNEGTNAKTILSSSVNA